MAKLVITITEKLVSIPGDSECGLVGLEIDSRIEYAEGEEGKPSALPMLRPMLESAVDVARKLVFGESIHSAPGPITEESEQIALEKATALQFPAELEA